MKIKLTLGNRGLSHIIDDGFIVLRGNLATGLDCEYVSWHIFNDY